MTNDQSIIDALDCDNINSILFCAIQYITSIDDNCKCHAPVDDAFRIIHLDSYFSNLLYLPESDIYFIHTIIRDIILVKNKRIEIID